MARCRFCFNVITAKDEYCYNCGDRVPTFPDAVKRRPVSGWTNVVFIASLAFTAYCFFVEHKLSMPLTIAVSCTLLLLRILAEYIVNRTSN
jgi:hypothetical protein